MSALRGGNAPGRTVDPTPVLGPEAAADGPRDRRRPALPYMYHCHMLLHEDERRMGQFAVIEPGQEDQVDRG